MFGMLDSGWTPPLVRLAVLTDGILLLADDLPPSPSSRSSSPPSAAPLPRDCPLRAALGSAVPRSSTQPRVSMKLPGSSGAFPESVGDGDGAATGSSVTSIDVNL